jgi:hypothetical protein
VLSDPDRAFLANHPPREMAEDEAYWGSISSTARADLIADREDAPLSRIFALLWEAAPLLWSDAERALERSGIAGAERVAVKQFGSAAAIFTRVAQALGAPATILYRTEDPAAVDVQVVCVSPPIVVLGPRVQGLETDRPRGTELRFLLGRAAELTRPERIIAAGLPPDELAGLVASLARSFGNPNAAPAGGDGDAQRDELLRTTLPVKLRTQLAELLSHAGPRELDVERYLEASNRAADRAGLLVSGDIASAARFVRARLGKTRGAVRHLLEAALSPSYLATRAKLGVGVRTAKR